MFCMIFFNETSLKVCNYNKKTYQTAKYEISIYKLSNNNAATEKVTNNTSIIIIIVSN